MPERIDFYTKSLRRLVLHQNHQNVRLKMMGVFEIVAESWQTIYKTVLVRKTVQVAVPVPHTTVRPQFWSSIQTAPKIRR